MSRRFAVTGSSGFIARHLIPRLTGPSVRGLDLRPCEADFGNRYQHTIGDVRDSDAVTEFVRGVDTLVHLAAEHQDFGVSDEQFFDVNVRGMSVLLSACGEAGIKEFVFFSSVAVYGARDEPTHEQMTPSPNGPYGSSKLEAEWRLLEWAEEASGRKALIVRPTVVYGEYNYANMYRLMSAIRRRRYVQVGPGTNRKSIAYVGNVAAAVSFLLDRARPGAEVFNLADEPAMTSRAIAEHLAQELGVGLPALSVPEFVALPLAMPLDWLASISGKNLPVTSSRIRKYLTDTEHQARALRAAGFQPPVAPEEGMARTVRWFQREA